MSKSFYRGEECEGLIDEVVPAVELVNFQQLQPVMYSSHVGLSIDFNIHKQHNYSSMGDVTVLGY